jgi:cytochrome c oxidase subunit IV
MKGQAMAATQAGQGPGMRVYLVVWVGLILIVGVEVLLTYAHLSTTALLAGLLGLAIIEAGVALAWFMHLKYERRILFWCLIPALVFVLLMMNQFWSDALRLLSLRPWAP